MPITPLIIRRPDVSPERRMLLEDDVSSIQPARSSPPTGQQHSHAGGRCSIGNFLRARLPCSRHVAIPPVEGSAGTGRNVQGDIRAVEDDGASRTTPSGIFSTTTGQYGGDSSMPTAGPSRPTAIPAPTGSASGARFSPVTPMSSLPPLVSALSSSSSTAFTSALATPTAPTPLQLHLDEPRVISASASVSPQPSTAPVSITSGLSPRPLAITGAGQETRKAFPHTADLLGSPSERGAFALCLPPLADRSTSTVQSGLDDASEDISMAETTPSSDSFPTHAVQALQQAEAATDGPSLIVPDRRLFPGQPATADERLERIRERLLARRVQVGRIRAQEQVRNMERERDRSASRSRETSGNSLAQGMRRSGEYAGVAAMGQDEDQDAGMGRNVRQRLAWEVPSESVRREQAVAGWETQQDIPPLYSTLVASPADVHHSASGIGNSMTGQDPRIGASPTTGSSTAIPAIGSPRPRRPLGRAGPSDRQSLAPIPLGPPRPLPEVYSAGVLPAAGLYESLVDEMLNMPTVHGSGRGGSDRDESEAESEEDEENEEDEEAESEEETEAQGSDDERDEGTDVDMQEAETAFDRDDWGRGSDTRAVMGGQGSEEDSDEHDYRDPFLPSPAALFGANYAVDTTASASTMSSVDEFARRYRQPGQPPQSLMRSPPSADRAPLFADRFGQLRRERSGIDEQGDEPGVISNTDNLAAPPSDAAFSLGSRTTAADWYAQPSTTRLADLRDRLARFDRVRAAADASRSDSDPTAQEQASFAWQRRDWGASIGIGRESETTNPGASASNTSAGSSNDQAETINGLEIYDQAIRDWRARAQASTSSSGASGGIAQTDPPVPAQRPSWRTMATAGSRYGQWRAEMAMGADGNTMGEGERDLTIPHLLPTYLSQGAAESQATVPAPRARGPTRLFGESPDLVPPEIVRLPRAYQQPETRATGATAALASDTSTSLGAASVPRGGARPIPISPTSSRAAFARMQGLEWPTLASTNSAGAGAGAGAGLDSHPFLRRAEWRRRLHDAVSDEDVEGSAWADLSTAAGPASAEASSTALDRDRDEAMAGVSGWSNEAVASGDNNRSEARSRLFPGSYSYNGSSTAGTRTSSAQATATPRLSTWTPTWTHPGERHRHASTVVRDPTLLLSGGSTAGADHTATAAEERVRLARVQAMVEAEALAATRRESGAARDVPPYLAYPTSRAQMQASYRSLFQPNEGRFGMEGMESRMQGRQGPMGPGVADGYVGYLDIVGRDFPSAAGSGQSGSTAGTSSGNRQPRYYNPVGDILSNATDHSPPSSPPASMQTMPLYHDYYTQYAHPSTLLHPSGQPSVRADTSGTAQANSRPTYNPFAHSTHALPNVSSSIVAPCSADMPATEKRAFMAMISRAVGRLSGASRRGAAESVLSTVKYRDWEHSVGAEIPDDAGGSGQRREPALRVLGQCPYAGTAAAAKESVKAALKKIVGGMQKEVACSICHDDYEPDSKIDVTPCRHSYHKDCLEMWLNQPNSTTASCPMCRRDMAVLACLGRFVPNHDMREAHTIWMSA